MLLLLPGCESDSRYTFLPKPFGPVPPKPFVQFWWVYGSNGFFVINRACYFFVVLIGKPQIRMQANSLSNLQLELLRTYSRNVSDDDIMAIRQFLARYFADKAMSMADQVWDANDWTSSDTQRLAQIHNRKSKAS